MVPSQIVHQLHTALQELQQLSLGSTQYQSPLREVVFEVTSFDTAIAGIATTLVQGQGVTPQLLSILRRQLPFRDGCWRTEEGIDIDISQHEEILEYIAKILYVQNLAQSLVTSETDLFA